MRGVVKRCMRATNCPAKADAPVRALCLPGCAQELPHLEAAPAAGIPGHALIGGDRVASSGSNAASGDKGRLLRFLLVVFAWRARGATAVA